MASISKPRWEGDDKPPANWRRLHEASWLFARFWHAFGRLGPRGPEDGPPALVIPGFIANDRTTMTLRRSLAAAGWRVHGWDLGFNWGARADTIELLKRQLDKVSADGKVLVVGWSLGGLFARELARACPERVLAVATLGSPFSGDPKQNNVWRLYERVAGHKVDDPPIPRITDKPPVPTLAVWSPLDGIVAVRAARGLAEESDKTVEMACTHMAFGVSRKVADQVALEVAAFLKSHGLETPAN